jgi:hypothetical protein
MSDTGATPEQIEAAFDRVIAKLFPYEVGLDSMAIDRLHRDTNLFAGALVPFDHRIIGPEQLAYLRMIYDTAITVTPYDRFDGGALDFLAALIGDAE